MSAWTWAAASSRGTSHDKTGTRIQDAFSCWSPASSLPIVALISDGAGTASHGGEGASLVCRSLMTQARRHFSNSVELPSDADIEAWFDLTRDLIGAVAVRRSLELRDFAATSVCVFSTGSRTAIAHVGDGCAVLRETESGRWIAPSWPRHGEYAATTYFVTDAESLQLRITRPESAIEAFAVFSDGIERLALDFAALEPSHNFFDKMAAPIRASAGSGRDANLSRSLKAYLGSSTVNSRTDDDKSLVLAVFK
jgi:Protein phosphatase 2C